MGHERLGQLVLQKQIGPPLHGAATFGPRCRGARPPTQAKASPRNPLSTFKQLLRADSRPIRAATEYFRMILPSPWPSPRPRPTGPRPSRLRAGAPADDGRGRARPDQRPAARDRDAARQWRADRDTLPGARLGRRQRPISFAPMDRPRQCPYRPAAGHLSLRRACAGPAAVAGARSHRELRRSRPGDRLRRRADECAAASSCARATSRIAPSTRSSRSARPARRSSNCSTPADRAGSTRR